MSKYFKEIAEAVKDGSYFSDARSWYGSKYIFPLVERSYFILICIAAFLILLLSFSTYKDIQPLKKEIPMLVNIPDTSEEYARIRKLARNENIVDTNIILMKFLSSRYIKAWESYDYKDEFQQIHKNINYIGQFSIINLQKRYDEKVSIRNPDSITLRYRDDVVRKIEVYDGDLADDGRTLPNSFLIANSNTMPEAANKMRNAITPFARQTIADKEDQYTVIMDYEAIEITEDGEETSTHRAKIDFFFPKLRYNREEEKFEDLEFFVIDYQTVEIE